MNSLVKREMYLSKIRPFYDDLDTIKVITGIRRSGKSVILNQIKDEISKKTSNIIYMNFENLLDLNKASDALSLINYIHNLKDSNQQYYLFFDEIQLVTDWSKAIKTLRLENNSIFITGSNSSLLSSEFQDLLSGRFVSFQVRPFVYKEILEYSKINNKEVSVIDYLIWGGFPKRFSLNSTSELELFLTDLNDTIINHDIISRYLIKDTILFKKVTDFVLKSNSRIVSTKSIYDYIKNEKYNCSINTIKKYIEYLKNAFIISEVEQYSSKLKRELLYYYKIYDADVSFNSLRVTGGRYDIDHNLENIVYNELIYRGYKLSTYIVNNEEIDFIATENNKQYLVQVAHSVVDEKAYEREFKAFNKLDSSIQKILITLDDVDFSTSTVRHIKFKDFLLIDKL